MPLIQFCSNCWAENLIGATICDRCGTSLSETEAIFYDQKLLRALHHPVPETREMAAMLLGLRQDQPALPVLMSRLLEESDMGVLCAISKALGQLGDCRARRIAFKALVKTKCTRGGTDHCRYPGSTRPNGMLGGSGCAQGSTSRTGEGGRRDHSEVGNAQSVVLLIDAAYT